MSYNGILFIIVIIVIIIIIVYYLYTRIYKNIDNHKLCIDKKFIKYNKTREFDYLDEEFDMSKMDMYFPCYDIKIHKYIEKNKKIKEGTLLYFYGNGKDTINWDKNSVFIDPDGLVIYPDNNSLVVHDKELEWKGDTCKFIFITGVKNLNK